MDSKPGNDLTFQTFPKDLQQHLANVFPPHLKVQSSLYPTYKSKKPISFATHNFLEWLETQPPGPVILMAHSMGGLLAADAATNTSNKAHRVIGMVAFDTPYLGMHPHVVISGIASLIPKDDDEEKKSKPSERKMNHPHVAIVDEAVTDDWEAYKQRGPSVSLFICGDERATDGDIEPEASKSSISIGSSHTQSFSATPPTLPPYSPHSPPTSPGSSSLDPEFYINKALSHPFVSGSLKFISAAKDDPLVKWARKHSDAPFVAGKTWIVEHFQFGSCMFDISDLKERYARLVAWEGLWVNYWTETLPRKKGGEMAEIEVGEQRDKENDVALLETGIAEPNVATDENASEQPLSPAMTANSPSTSELKAMQKAEAKATSKAEKERLKEEKAVVKAAQKAAKKGIVPPRHFIVLPTGLGRILGGSEKWEGVVIAGVQDEVAAHCGLFIRDQNLDYDGLVERVGAKVLKWCESVR
ncbi:hypothetical protein HWV62_41386 [Athelia sp. TMB]|nr:hypothetical protein HWV62_41386 [Athelia sp. TMB]